MPTTPGTPARKPTTREAGTRPAYRPTASDMRPTIEAMARDGLRPSEIAARLGLMARPVHELLHRLDLCPARARMGYPPRASAA